MKKIKGIAGSLVFFFIFPGALLAQEQAILVPLEIKMQTERFLEHSDVKFAYFYCQ
ncbi:MAG TPA: hypothetical protein PK114_05855 [Smithellaceae bacterium]|nr:hypothetical protein [Smithellaceae bacterium]